MSSWGWYFDRCMGRGLSERTATIYTGLVRRYVAWCGTAGYDVDTAPPHAVRTWADMLPATHGTRRQARSALKVLYAGRADEPWLAVRVPRKPQPAPKPLDDDELARLLDAARLVGGRRGLAVFVLAYTGARTSEVAGMTWDGYDGHSLRWWRSKTEEWHTLPVHPTLRAELDACRRLSGAMFTGDRGRDHVTANTIGNWVDQCADLAGIRCTPRQLRASVATRILDATGSLEAAASVLGHRSTDTTRRYARTSDRRLAEAVSTLW